MAVLLSAVTALAPLWQSKQQFNEMLEVETDLHRRSIEQATELHREEQALENALQAQDIAVEKELHYAEMSREVDIARREAIRDVWNQKSGMQQTLQIVATLMFSCAASTFCEGDMPSQAPIGLVRLYALTLGTAMAVLVVSLWVSKTVQARMGRYDMHNPRQRYVCGRTHVHFHEFFECHCQSLSRACTVLFVTGAALTVLGGGLFTTASLYYRQQLRPAAWVFLALSCMGLLVAVLGMLPTVVSSEGSDMDSGGLAGVEHQLRAVRQQAKRAQETQSAEAVSANAPPGKESEQTDVDSR